MDGLNPCSYVFSSLTFFLNLRLPLDSHLQPPSTVATSGRGPSPVAPPAEPTPFAASSVAIASHCLLCRSHHCPSPNAIPRCSGRHRPPGLAPFPRPLSPLGIMFTPEPPTKILRWARPLCNPGTLTPNFNLRRKLMKVEKEFGLRKKNWVWKNFKTLECDFAFW